MSGEPPPFARAFPAHPDLEAAVRAFTAGDYARTRELCDAIARSAAPADVKLAAAGLVARTSPPRTALVLLVATAVLLAAVGGYWMAHGKPPPSGAPARPAMANPSR